MSIRTKDMATFVFVHMEFLKLRNSELGSGSSEFLSFSELGGSSHRVNRNAGTEGFQSLK